MAHHLSFVRPAGKTFATLFMAASWFFIEYRIYHDGPHHFFHHHSWSEPEAIAYLEELDKKYGTSLATDNQHHH